MKGLSINRLAAAGLRVNRRGYRAMAAGIFLSIFLVATLCQCAWGVYAAALQSIREKLGRENFFVMDSPEFSDERLMESGDFEKLGHVTLTARAGSRFIGYADETALDLLNRRCLAGRLPQAAGELAAEQSFLDYLALEASLGDVVEITCTPIDGLEETRTFTLVGILSEQSSAFSWESVSYAAKASQVYGLPSALCSAQEPSWQSGREAVQRLLTLSEGAYFNEVIAQNWRENNERDESRPLLIGLSRLGSLTLYEQNLLTLDNRLTAEEGAALLTMLMLLGGALLLACCVGIAGAMEGQLARKREEIGLLRAVGATKKQIRRIFGREAWLLALVLSPLSLLCSCAAVWGLSRVNPEVMIFDPQPMILIPTLLISGLCILVSAALPLRRATRILPMGVLRDTALLRRMGRVRSRSVFKPSRLIAWRQNRLHPLRPLGAGLLAGLMMICVLAALAILSRTGDYFFKSSVSFSAYFYSPYASYNDYYTAVAERTLSENDIRQIEAMEGVTGVSYESEGHVNVLMDTVPDYLTDADPEMYCSVWDEETFLRRYEDSLVHINSLSVIGSTPENALEAYQRKRETRLRVQNETQTEAGFVLPMNFAAMDEQALLKCADTVTDGKIDMQALNEGREVLLCVPDLYVEYMVKDSQIIGTSTQTTPFGQAVLQASNRGDFAAGQTMNLMLLTVPDSVDREAEAQAGFYAQAERTNAQVNIGAVLNTSIFLHCSYDNAPVLLTTHQGLRALGLSTECLSEIRISTDSALTEEEEQALSERVQSVLRRADNMSFYDQLQQRREAMRQNRMYLVALISVALLFFVVAVSMITGDVTRRIRADTRMIGTLRAVGADAATVARCYRMQISLSLGLGLLLALAALLYVKMSPVQYVDWFYGAAALSVPLFALLCYGACLLTLKSRIREMISRSIVECIREM